MECYFENNRRKKKKKTKIWEKKNQNQSMRLMVAIHQTEKMK